MLSLFFCMVVVPSFGGLFDMFNDNNENIINPEFEKVFDRNDIIERQNNPKINTIIDEFMVFFDLECLAEKKSLGRNIIGEFMTEFPCYELNEEKEDKFPEIMDQWIVVNKKNECNNDDDKKIIWKDFCIKNVEQNEEWQHDSSICNGCVCKSRTVSSTLLWNLYDACPSVAKGVAFLDIDSQTIDPNFDIFVVDSGISSTHAQFNGINITQIYGDDNITSNHGTFIAGVIGGYNVGVMRLKDSPFVKLIDVKLGSSALSEFMNAFDSIIDYLNTTNRKGIINLSYSNYGNGVTPIINRIEEIYNLNGIIFCSAGNDNTNASLYYPPSSPYTITVGNHESNLLKYLSSNYGDAVDIYGPGSDIYSTSYESDSAFTTGTGTSYAAPFVAGVAANILLSNPDYDFDNLLTKLLDYAEYDIIDRNGKTDEPRVQISCDEYVTDDTLLDATTPSPTEACTSDISGDCYIINENSFDGNYSGSYKQFCDPDGYRVTLLWTISNNCTDIDDRDINGYNIAGDAIATYKYDTSCC